MKYMLRSIFISLLIMGVAGITGCGSTTGFDLEAADADAQPEVAKEIVGGDIIIDDDHVAIFKPAESFMKLSPFPSDILIDKSTGMVSVPLEDPANPTQVESAVVINGLNQLDGFGLNASAIIEFSHAVDPASVVGKVKVVEVAKTVNADGSIDMAVVDELEEGIDFDVHVEQGTFIVVTPKVPYKKETTYVIGIDEGVMAADGIAFEPAGQYRVLSKLDVWDDIDKKADLYHLVQAELGALAGIEPIVSTSFTTQSIGDELEILAQRLATGEDIAMLGNFQPVYDFGVMVLFQGTLMKLTYSQYRTDPLAAKWDADLTSTMEFVPVLLTVPTGAPPPWPVHIFQHGITGNRTNMLAVAGALAMAGQATIAIDQPHHGLIARDPATCGSDLVCVLSAYLYLGDMERLINISPDPANPTQAGDLTLNVANVITARDNLRQATYDILALAAAVKADTTMGFDASELHLTGHSLGAIVATPAVGMDVFDTISLVTPGARIVEDTLHTSPALAPTISYLLMSQVGVMPGSVEELRYLPAGQMAMDGADPGSFQVAIDQPVLLIEALYDQVIPNTATDYMIDALMLDRVGVPYMDPNYQILQIAHAMFSTSNHGLIVDLPVNIMLSTFSASGGYMVKDTLP